MKKESIFTKCSLGILIVSILVLVNEFIQLIPTHSTRLEGLLLYFGPSIFAIIGGILSIIGLIKHKTKLGVFLIAINVILLFWPMILMYVGTLIWGV
ncbi:hypothetical protein [Clostridium estertheticum]|uniref:Uncharacterized protein n=1 Tax=Clostridium estertheticum subsp. estertheticum TaxID=1552 RepID=A0A1J0GM92_9CLOT|nr:hypothetical protein [Clostridium estertheticum]APC42006.1 hypothetical protein A7L45_19000 [Clostridium estertheticum subsp. estertheticum]MBU3075898.1 hypothetical protein [Clostridium estertheticum]MBU3165860.1 hypothetical protein [Clostridium estertheticum]MBU3172925.1 hypothetical protein [Clostridium estertheticum]MBU3184011.1 hypothetical protein [Clostridium estertheticum]